MTLTVMRHRVEERFKVTIHCVSAPLLPAGLNFPHRLMGAAVGAEMSGDLKPANETVRLLCDIPGVAVVPPRP